jgi:hypothetical protein
VDLVRRCYNIACCEVIAHLKEREGSLVTAQPSRHVAASNRNSITGWRKSRASNGAGECVEVTTAASFVLARDSRDPSGAVLTFTSAQWLGLVRHIRQDRAVRG